MLKYSAVPYNIGYTVTNNFNIFNKINSATDERLEN